MGMRNEFDFRWENPVNIRSCACLNDLVEQDHGRIPFRTQPMLGFKSFYNAKRVLIGIELVQEIYKGQFHMPASLRPSLADVWSNVLACSEILNATEPLRGSLS
jgi:transposase-like protein